MNDSVQLLFKRLQEKEWEKEAGISEDSVRELQKMCRFPLPQDYLDILRWSNGGVFADEEGRFYLMSSNEVIYFIEKDYSGQDMPNVLDIGTDGSGHVYALRYNLDDINRSPELILYDPGNIIEGRFFIIGNSFLEGMNVLSEKLRDLYAD